MYSVAKRMLFRKTQCQVTGPNELSPFRLARRALACVGKLVTDEVDEDQACRDRPEDIQKIKAGKTVRVLVIRPQPLKIPMHAQVAFDL